MTDRRYMEIAINNAVKSKDVIQVGTVIVLNDEIVGESYSKVLEMGDASRHSEINAMKLASKYINSRLLIDCELYTTHEPCPMCSGMIGYSKIKKVIYGIGYENSSMKCNNIFKTFNWNVEVIENFMESECLILLKTKMNKEK